jgi:chitinase
MEDNQTIAYAGADSATGGHGDSVFPPEPPARELSPLRVLLLLIVLCGIGFGVWTLVTHRTTAADAESHAVPVYAPYVDVTLTPTYQFQLPAEDPVSSAYLGFIVSKPDSACTPSWGGYYTLAQADQTLNLQARIAQLRSQGGSAMLSFGGRDNGELAVGCTNTGRLTQAYRQAIDQYRVTGVDFDIEGAALTDAAANARRAQAIASIQRQMAREHRTLKVWVTLPVSNRGLTGEGVAVVRSMLAAHVTLAGVNALAMDFGSGEGAGRDLFSTIRDALYATHSQVQALWLSAGLSGGGGVAWQHLGATVMLGVNDITAERFTISDARRLEAFANRMGVARVSAWSLNRDTECGSAYPVTGVVSNNCSGVLQDPLQFTKILSHLKGTKTARRQAESTSAPTTAATDNPATSPYPVWNSASAYVAGYKVVWQGDIYESNWWSQGTAPDSGTADSSGGSPWLLIGPVPTGSKAFKPKLLISTSPPAWSAQQVYHQGAQVSFDGLPYQARYYTQGDQPVDQLPGSSSTPWAPLFTAPGEPNDTGIGSGSAQ